MNERPVLNNFLWRFLERCGAQGVAFIVSIVLARLLAPETYGIIALVTALTTLLQVFVDSGLGVALIQKQDADDLDFSTVFYFNLAMCLFLYALVFLAAPWIAVFYEIPQLTSLIRTLSLTLVISGLQGIQQSYVARNMQFKRFFFSTLGATLFSAAVGIGMACRGFGVWALVGQTLSNQLVATVILWFTVQWRPRLLFSFDRLKGLFSYGWKLLASSLLETGYNELQQLVVGKFYSADDLAYYNRGRQFPHLVVHNVNLTVDSVLFSAMSVRQSDQAKVREMTRRAVMTGTYVMMPVMAGLVVCAEPLVRLLLTEKWLPCVFFLRTYCVSSAFYPLHAANLNAIKALGRSDLYLKLELIKRSIGLVALGATMFLSPQAIAVGLLISALLAQIVDTWPNKKLLRYGYFQQLRDVFPQLVLSCIMGAGVYWVRFLQLGDFLTLLLQVILGVTVYVVLSHLLRPAGYLYLLSLLKNYRKK